MKLVTTPECHLLAAPFYLPNTNNPFRFFDDKDLQGVKKKIWPTLTFVRKTVVTQVLLYSELRQGCWVNFIQQRKEHADS